MVFAEQKFTAEQYNKVDANWGITAQECKDSWFSPLKNKKNKSENTFNNLGVLACIEWLAKQDVLAHST